MVIREISVMKQIGMPYRAYRILLFLVAIFVSHFKICEGQLHVTACDSASNISSKVCAGAVGHPKVEVCELHESQEEKGKVAHPAYLRTFLSDITEVRLANKPGFNKFSNNVAYAGVRTLFRFVIPVHDHVAKSHIYHTHPCDYYIFALRKILI